MKQHYLFFLLFIILNIANGQHTRLGEVTISDFKTESVTDPNPDAIFIYKKVHIDFQDNVYYSAFQHRTIHHRILIKNEKGLRYATIQLDLYRKSLKDSERIDKLKGYTYNLVDGKIQKESLKKSAVFKEDLSENYFRKAFVMPNVQVGSIIEYEYTIDSSTYAIDDVIIQEQVPVNLLDFKLNPRYDANYNILLNPRSDYLSQLTEQGSKKSLLILDKDNDVRLLLENVPAFKSEPMAGEESIYIAKMILELKEILRDSNYSELLSNDWYEVSVRVLKKYNLQEALTKEDFFKNDFNERQRLGSSEEEQLQEVLNFLKTKVVWNGRYGKYPTDGFKEIYQKGDGNAADINLLLVLLLRSMDIDANPVLVSTKNNGTPTNPTLDGFNYVVVEAAMPSGNKYLLDGTEKYASPNVLPVRALNWQGRVIKDLLNSYWTDLMPKYASKELTQINVAIGNDLKVDAILKKRLTKHSAYNLRNRLEFVDEDKYREVLSKNKSGLDISNVVISEKENVLAPLEYTYNFNFRDGVETIGDKLYISPLFHEATSINPFILDERKLPIDFSFPVSYKYTVLIKLPEGYEVMSLPKNLSTTFNDNKCSYSYVLEQVDNAIRLSSTLDITQSIILPEEYKLFKEFFAAMVDKELEKIVLTKTP